nr:unnamed protein product [Digitaria exilis]
MYDSQRIRAADSRRVATAASRIEKLEAASSKIFGGDRARIRRVEELRETIRATEDAKFCALREYERIKAAYAEKIVDGWETVAEETSGYARGSDNAILGS